MTNCDKKFTFIQSENFGDRKKITSTLLQNYGENDTWLHDQIMQLWDSTDPENRHIFYPILCDDFNSYGVVYDSAQQCYKFSNMTTWTGSTSFKNLIPVDPVKTDAYIDVSKGRATLPPIKQAVVTTTEYQGPWDKLGLSGCNSHWYISFNRNTTYNAKDEWIKNMDSTEIPCTCRGQTFRPLTTGYLTGLTLNLIGSSKAEYPLIVEIRDSTGHNVIAKTEYKFDVVSFGGLVTIPFEQPPLLTKGEKYSFTLRSPLTSFENHYAIGGWNKYCYDGKTILPYQYGSAWLSEDNFASWSAYGKDEEVDYHNGKYMPQDFGFQLNIQPFDKYPTDKTYYVYFKPQMMNPITKTIFSCLQSDLVNTTVEYEISSDGKTWYTIGEDNSFTYLWDAPYPKYLFTRVGLTSTSDSVTPYSDYIRITCTTLEAMEAMLRTHYWNPEKRQILGASCWSEADAPYYFDPGTYDEYEKPVAPEIDGEAQVSVLVDIVKDKRNIDHFNLISKSTITDYLSNTQVISTYLGKDYSVNDEMEVVDAYMDELLDGLKTVGSDDYDATKVSTFITSDEGKKFYAFLNKMNIYYADELTKFYLKEPPAYPMLNVSYRPFTADETNVLVKLADGTQVKDAFTGENLTTDITYTKQYSEWFDYTVNYDEDYLEFTNSTGVVTTLDPGHLVVEYNPCFVKDLNCESLPLKLDLFKESFVWEDTTDERLDTDTDTFQLAVEPMNAIRKVLVNEDTNSEIELIENKDFTVDYIKNTITFKPVRLTYKTIATTEDTTCPYTTKIENNITVLNPADTVSIRYTPYLPDNGLSFCYHLTRTNSKYQVMLEPNYLQYRV